MMKKGFTLAEILIVLVIIGVLTMILLPMAFQSSPDEEVMKFKKGYNTITTAIKELVSSDEYYQDGDLGIRANGNLIDGNHEGDITYFCQTLADLLNTKSVNCYNQTGGFNRQTGYTYVNEEEGHIWSASAKGHMDKGCKLDPQLKPEIVTTDGIIYYMPNPSYTFGVTSHKELDIILDDTQEMKDKINNSKDIRRFLQTDEDGFLINYRILCMDIDEIGKGEDPFAIGVRVDGKILNGLRAEEWLNKKIQN